MEKSKLKETESNSILVVSAFHVVEHIPFEYLQELVKESYRVLMPGGLLILETPNLESLEILYNLSEQLLCGPE